MKKVHIGFSFILLCVVCIVFHEFKLLVNYFLALLLHELTHYYVASRRGYKLKSFNLSMFGLNINLDRDVEDRDGFWVNLAGPMSNLFLCLLCLALYSIFPQSFFILNNFCLCNFVLAVFNLLPVYPLDGGKIFRSLIRSDKLYKRLDLILRICFALVFGGLFIFSVVRAINNGFVGFSSIFFEINWFFLIFALFFLLSKGKQTPTFSIFKFSAHKTLEKINLIKVNGEENLYKLIKRIKKHSYTIFYYPTAKKYIDEDTALELALKYPLTTEIKDLRF